MTRKIEPGLALLLLGCLFSMICCGMVATEVLSPIPPGLVSALAVGFSGQDAPLFSHFLGGLFFLVAAVIAFAGRKVVQTPSPKILIALSLLLGIIWISVGISKFKGMSIAAATEWSVYLVALVATVALAGRKRGPLMVCGAIVAGGLVLSLSGFLEYLANWKVDKTWRIFAGWTPNSLASILLVATILALTLGITQKGKWRLLGLAAAPTLGALLLTQSKGGLLAFVAGLVCLVAFQLAVSRPTILPWMGRISLVAVLLFAFVPAFVGKLPDAKALASASQTSAPDSILKRFQGAGATADQSVGFRKLLWVSGLRIWAANPLGTGIGTFRPYSAQPGLITQTQLAHNSLLQFAQEVGVLGILALAAVLFLVGEAVFSSNAGAPNERLKLGIFAAMLAGLFHSATESNLYTFGFGVIIFVLLGLCLQLSTDAVTPEYVPQPGKLAAVLTMSVCAVTGGLMGYVELQKGAIKSYATSNQPELVQASLESLQGVAPFDADTWFDAGTMTGVADSRISFFQHAIDAGPLPKYYRALAVAKRAKGDFQGAEAALNEVAAWDPNNMLALDALIQTQIEAGDREYALQTAQKLVAVEQTPYFQIRSIKEVIPTETYRARLLLAKSEPDPSKRQALLAPALEGFLAYAKTTVPEVKKMAALDGAGYGGETVPRAKRALGDALEAAKLAQDPGAGFEPQAKLAWANAQRTFEAALQSIQ